MTHENGINGDNDFNTRRYDLDVSSDIGGDNGARQRYLTAVMTSTQKNDVGNTTHDMDKCHDIDSKTMLTSDYDFGQRCQVWSRDSN